MKGFDEPKYLTAEQVCELLQIKRTTLQKWKNAKKIPYMQIDKILRFKRSDIDKFVNNNLVTPDEHGRSY